MNLQDFFEAIQTSIEHFTLLDILDILLVAIVIYSLLKITSKTRAIQVLKGLGVIIIVAQLCELLHMPTIAWLLNSVVNAGAVFIVILFQPEIRRSLEKIGRGRLFDISFNNTSEDFEETIEAIQRAILNMSKRKIGALVVFEDKTGLRDVIESGTLLEAAVSSELIENVFFPNSPMHDGAMIIKGSSIVAAGCFLPLSDNKQISNELGTRHRAALGISEISDAHVLIVSEETGVISTAHEGTITRYLDRKALRKLLDEIYTGREGTVQILGNKLKRKGAKK